LELGYAVTGFNVSSTFRSTFDVSAVKFLFKLPNNGASCAILEFVGELPQPVDRIIE
jgi:hypothetical protein